MDNLSACLDNKLEIKKELVFLHDIEAGNYTVIINLLILLTSRYIYVCKCLETRPRFQGVLKKISELEYIERKISQKNNRMYNHNKKWRQIATYL